MNTWSQNQNQNSLGQVPYNQYTWNVQPQRLPVYRADPIHGQNAAWQFPMGPNSEIYLPDADEDIIWWIRSDANGNKNVMAFDAKPHETPKQVDMEEINARLAAVEEWINGKQNKSNAKRNTAPATVATVPTVVE